MEERRGKKGKKRNSSDSQGLYCIVTELKALLITKNNRGRPLLYSAASIEPDKK